MDKKLYLISIQVEGCEQEEASKADMNDDDDGLDDFGNDEQHEDDKDATDDQHQMDTEGNVGDLVGQGGDIAGIGFKTVVDKSISEAMKEQTGNRVGDKSQESEVNVDNLDLQLPTSIAHLYTEGLGHDVVDSQDHDQMVRWMKFLEEHEDEGDIAGTDLLKTMELVDENVLVGSIEKADQDYDSGASDREMLNVDDEQIELGK
jgi:hypothetical protein